MYDERTRVLRLIMEFKYGYEFNNSYDRAKVLGQVIFYLKQFTLYRDENYMDVPNVILAGDKTTCFVISSSEVEQYLDENLDWDTAPSLVPAVYKEFVERISKDNNINPIIYTIDKNFSFSRVAVDIKRLILKLQIKLKVTEKNILETYDYFIQKVIISPENYSASDLVQSFIGTILGDVEISRKRNCRYIAKKDRRIAIDDFNYSHFEEQHCAKYSLKERNLFISIKDRLTEDTTRRFKGEFFTPTIWVNEAYKIFEDVLGEDFRSEYVVWDPAWGTGNLTRDFSFTDLYCSTLDNSDLELGESYNVDSSKFQYTFLNDDVDDTESGLDKKMPKSLYQDLQSKDKVLFFLNPPFAESSNGKTKNKKSKDRVADTIVKKHMINDGYKDASQQIYIQFLYRILQFKKMFNIEHCSIGIFTPALFFTGERSEKFRNEFLDNFKFEKGIIFNASYFSNVSSQWGICFSVWSSGKTLGKHRFTMKIGEMDEEGSIIYSDTKTLYNLDTREKLSTWIKNKSYNDFADFITLKSALKVDSKYKKVPREAIAFLMNDSNNVYANTQGVYILSAPVTRHVKVTAITKENYKECFTLFAARTLIKSNWLNQKDNYCIPNSKDLLFSKFENDCIVYAVFSEQCGIASYRRISVNNKILDIKNEMFFMSIKVLQNLADKYSNFDVYNDCLKYSGERYLYNELCNLDISQGGHKILNYAEKLVIESFEYRDEFNKKYPEYQINTADAGWYQIKSLLKEYMSSDLIKFQQEFNEFAAELEPFVYKLGFLR